MDRRQLDLLLPMLLGLAVVVCAMTATGALPVVCVVGGVAVGIYYAVFRRNLAGPTGGRQRNRNRR